jgi:hypothetical protein
VNKLLAIELRRLGTATASPQVEGREPVHQPSHQSAQHSVASPQTQGPEPLHHHTGHQPVQHVAHRPSQQSAQHSVASPQRRQPQVQLQPELLPPWQANSLLSRPLLFPCPQPIAVRQG